MFQTLSEPETPASFPSTHWSRVIAAADPRESRSREPLAAICRAYWYPLYAYIRRRGHGPESARDLTQDFFARLLERGTLAEADPSRGRFRSFLRTVCAHYLANRHDRETARKRGGGRVAVSIDAAHAEGRYERELAHEVTPDRIFDRSWALELLSRVLDRLRREYDEAGKAATFEILRIGLDHGPEDLPHAAIAARLGTTEGAARVAAHRLRRRYGELLRREIASTLNDPADVDDEIRDLFASLGS
ncbi:RNA polymerase sigma factor [Aquisphaera insulae]|uniref:RNA polymerase sigma factor n=1 Tax=Aquisphaera insulae TaxID=2712864 RepID=UPI0013EB4110|nr:sigma-70 family RNA polymerase sigma factor [Aquisphaera insulae]